MLFTSASNLLINCTNIITQKNPIQHENHNSSQISETFLLQFKIPNKILEKDEDMIRFVLNEFRKAKFSNSDFFLVDSEGLKSHSSFPDQFEFPSSRNNKNLCLISSSSLKIDEQNSLIPHFGILIHDLKIIKKIKKQQNASIVCSFSFTPFLFRCPSSLMMNVSQQQQLFSLLEETQKFVALNHEAAELGIGDLTLFHQNQKISSESFSSLSGIVLPFLDQVRILACGIDFPFVDEENKTILSFESSNRFDENLSSRREELATKHLINLRKWMREKISFSSDDADDDDEEKIIPLWLIPKDPCQVRFWCSICYPTQFFKKKNSDDDENDEHENKFHFLVPSSMILFSSVVRSASIVDARFGEKIPPHFRSKIQQDCFYELLDQVLFSSSTSKVSSCEFQLVENSTHFEDEEEKIVIEEKAPKRRGRTALK